MSELGRYSMTNQHQRAVVTFDGPVSRLSHNKRSVNVVRWPISVGMQPVRLKKQGTSNARNHQTDRRPIQRGMTAFAVHARTVEAVLQQIETLECPQTADLGRDGTCKAC